MHSDYVVDPYRGDQINKCPYGFGSLCNCTHPNPTKRINAIKLDHPRWEQGEKPTMGF